MSTSTPTPPRRFRRRLVLMAAGTAAAMLLTAPVALAGKPSGGGGGGGGKPSGGTSTMALVVVDSADGLPHHGGQIRFEVSSTATTEPHVEVQCFQSGARVYVAQTGYFADYPWPWTQTFQLSSGAWTGGAASCTAKLFWFSGTKTVVGKTMAFDVLA